MPSLTRPVVDVVADLSDAIACGDRDLSRALEVADAAKVGLQVSAEAAACGLAIVCIHDELQARVLGLPDAAFAALYPAGPSAASRVTLAWARLAQVIAAPYAGTSSVRLDDAGETCLSALALGGWKPSWRANSEP